MTDTKKCSKCGLVKLIEFFFKDRAFKDGYSSICKVCKTAATMKWREENKEHYNAYMRKKNKEHYPKDRLRRYGLTLEQHSAMLESQKGLCALCNKPPGGTRPLCVDHRHDETKKVRGLLCYGCNRLMVILDNPELLAKALAYRDKA